MYFLTLIGAFLLLSSCSRQALGPESDFKAVPEHERELVIVNYNVENLFDTHHDNDKEDWTFLPTSHPQKAQACAQIKSSYRRRECFETDWTQAKLEIKLKQIERILHFASGEMPDILALSEVENEAVLKMLAAKLGYQHFAISNGDDERGIDVAILWRESSKLSRIAIREHELKADIFSKRPTRPILEVEFTMGGEHKLFVFVNHWPSLANPNESRLVAANTLRARILEVQRKSPQSMQIAMGDFNTISRLHPHPFHDVLLKQSSMIDLEERVYNSLSYEEKLSRPPGTYFYAREMQWNKLDRVFVSENLLEGIEVRALEKSFRILAPSFATTQERYEAREHYLKGSVVTGVPWGYDHQASDEAKAGFSDHFAQEFKVKF